MNLSIDIAGQTVTATWEFNEDVESVEQPVRVNWGDGSAVEMVPSGDLNAVHVYAAAGFYRVEVRANDTSITRRIKVGDPTRPVGDPAGNRRRREDLRENAEAMVASSRIG